LASGCRSHACLLLYVTLFVIVFTQFASSFICFYFFFFNDPATTEIYTLSLHDALPIFSMLQLPAVNTPQFDVVRTRLPRHPKPRSEEHTSELQSHLNLVCRLLLEKKKKKIL